MYEIIKKLVENNKLTFNCEHRLNSKYYLQNEKGNFMEQIEICRELYPFYWERGMVLRDQYCFECGERINYKLEGEALVPMKDTSCFQEKEISIEIPVPTGEIMFDDWFEKSTPLFDHLDDKTIDINANKVRVQRTFDYHELGVGHFFVGGSSPNICQKDGTFYVGNGKSNDNDEELPVIDGAKILGYVSTELRWVTVCDYEIYEKLAIKKFGKEKGLEMAEEAKEYADLVVKVEPGTYRIRYYPKINRKELELYAKIEKVKKNR
jgi:hypothetical protein